MELDICPAASDKRLDGVHGGKNAGRACWVVAGSFARGNVECAFVKEHGDCATCDFHHQVKKEEGRYLWPATLLHRMLGEEIR